MLSHKILGGKKFKKDFKNFKKHKIIFLKWYATLYPMESKRDLYL